MGIEPGLVPLEDVREPDADGCRYLSQRGHYLCSPDMPVNRASLLFALKLRLRPMCWFFEGKEAAEANEKLLFILFLALFSAAPGRALSSDDMLNQRSFQVVADTPEVLTLVKKDGGGGVLALPARRPAFDLAQLLTLTSISIHDNQTRRYRVAALPSSESEEARLGRMRLMDYQPTGLHVRAGEAVTIITHGLVVAPSSLTIMVGAPDDHKEDGISGGSQRLDVSLGRAVFVSARSGLLYLRYLDAGPGVSPPPLDVELLGGRPIPLYILGKTRRRDWLDMLARNPSAPFVELVGEHAVITATRRLYNRFDHEDPAAVLGFIERLIGWYDEISGLDGSTALHAPSPLRLHYMQEPTQSSGARNDDEMVIARYAIRLSESAMANLLSAKKKLADAWSIWRITGRAYERFDWPREDMEGDGMNIYALYAAEKLGVSTATAQSEMDVEESAWQSAAYYLMPGIRDIGTYERFHRKNEDDEMSPNVQIYEQLRQSLGERFYPRLHQYYRAHPLTAGQMADGEHRMQVFAWRASIVAGYDLSSVFRRWNIPVSAEAATELDGFKLPAAEGRLVLPSRSDARE
ncbi:M60 family metallopeptidase [Labrys neptuniae]